MAGYGYNTGLDGHRVSPLTEQEIQDIAEGLATIYDRAQTRMLETVANKVSRGITRYGWAEKKASEVSAAKAQIERDLADARKERQSLLDGLADRAAMTGSQKFHSDMQAMEQEENK